MTESKLKRLAEDVRSKYNVSEQGIINSFLTAIDNLEPVKVWIDKNTDLACLHQYSSGHKSNHLNCHQVTLLKEPMPHKECSATEKEAEKIGFFKTSDIDHGEVFRFNRVEYDKLDKERKHEVLSELRKFVDKEEKLKEPTEDKGAIGAIEEITEIVIEEETEQCINGFKTNTAGILLAWKFNQLVKVVNEIRGKK